MTSRLEGQVTPGWDFRPPVPEGARSSRGGAEGQGGVEAAQGSVGRGRNAARRRVEPCVSSAAGTRAGHGGLCGPAGPDRGQSLVVPVADRGPRAEAALCGGWSWDLPTSGDHDDAEAPLVPVRDEARGPSPEPRERVPGQRGGQGTRPAGGDWSSTRERVLAGSRLRCPRRVPGGTRERGPEPWVVQGGL